MSEVIDPIAQRYGKRTANPKVLLTAGILAFLVFLAWAIWSVSASARPDFNTKGYQVLDPAHTKVTFTVTRPADRSVRCSVQAMRKDFGIVGFKELSFPAGKQSFTAEVVLNTTEPAVTGLVDNCWFY